MIYENKNISNISILLTAYKADKFIEECLDSIERQTYFNNNNKFEILLGIDGCISTLNKSLKIKNKYRNLNIFMIYENKGTYITRNTLLNYVKYDNIIFFDIDDIMCDDMIENIIKYKKNNDLIRLSYVNFGNKISEKPKPANGVIYIKKSVIEHVGGYKPWKCSADTELYYRLKNFYKTSNLNLKCFKRRVHDNNLSFNKKTGMNSDIRNKYRYKIFSTIYDKNTLVIKKVSNNNKIEIFK